MTDWSGHQQRARYPFYAASSFGSSATTGRATMRQPHDTYAETTTCRAETARRSGCHGGGRSIIAGILASEPWIADRDIAVMTLLYGCGLRISEALGLTHAQAPSGDSDPRSR